MNEEPPKGTVHLVSERDFESEGADGGMMFIPLDSRPEHAAALGRLLGHWAVVEMELIGILEYFLGIEQPFARLVWQEFVSTRGKINLLLRLNWATVDSAMKSKLDDLLNNAQDLNEVRNAYIHALWVDPGANSLHLMRSRNTSPGNYKKTFRKSEPFTPEAIQEDVTKFAKLSAALADWISHVRSGNAKPHAEPS
jgi:hypothetical protein